MKQKVNAKRAIEIIAKREGVPVETVRAEIEKAIQIGMSSPSPAVQKNWRKIPKKGEVPTPEELITYAALSATKKRFPLL